MFNWIKGKTKKGLCLVAHPDDCVMFAQAFIEEHKNINWTIVYLTHQATSSMGKEITAYWNAAGVDTRFLEFQDKIPLSYENEQVAVLSKLIGLGTEFDIVLTHNAVGEYKHVHHVLLNAVAQQLPQPKVYFGCNFFHNHTSPAPRTATPRLSLHEEAINEFDIATRCKYYIDDKAKEVL